MCKYKTSIIALTVQPHSMRSSRCMATAASTHSRQGASWSWGQSQGERAHRCPGIHRDRPQCPSQRRGCDEALAADGQLEFPPLAGPKPLAGFRRRFTRLQDAPSDLLTSTMCAACAIDPDCSPPASGCRACSDAWLPARAPASAGCGPSPDPPASAGAAPWPAAACAPGRPPPAANADKLGMLSGGVCGSAGCGGRAARALSTPSARPAGDAVWVGAGCGSAAAVMGRAVRAPLATGGPNPPGAGFVGGREDSMGAQAPSAADAVDARAGRSAAGSG